MRSSDSLFLLIKSMSKSEKRYFKQASSVHTIGEENNYVVLFDAIEAQVHSGRVYDESLVKQKLGSRFDGQLPVVKNYLYNEVLVALRRYHSSADTDVIVQSLIEQYDILYGRALFRQAGDMLKKAKRIAEETELLPSMLKIIEREKKQVRVSAGPAEFDSEFARIYSEELFVLEKIKNTIDFSDFRNKMVSFNAVLSTGMARTEQERAQIKEFLAHPLLQADESAITKITKRLSYQYRANLYFWLSELETSYKFHLKYLQECERQNSKYSSKEQLFSALYNVCTLQMRLLKDDECWQTIEKLKDFECIYKVKLNNREKNHLWYLTSHEEITFYTQTLRFEQGFKAMERIEKELQENEHNFYTNWKINLYYFIAVFYFTADNFTASQKWISKILQLPATDFSSDIQCFARIINLIEHYELKNFEHLDYIMKSTYYFLRKRQRIYKYEQVIIKYMKRSLRASSEQKLIELFEEMKDEMLVLQKDSYEKNGMHTFNILPWLQAKIEKISVAEALVKTTN